VDTAQDIRDIKKPIAAPFTFREALPWIIALLLLAGAGYFIFYYLKKRKKAEPVFRAPVKIKIPPHQVALDALENLRNKKLWQTGQVKEYHTELTDIIRDYIFGKFNIHAPELTSDEILNALNYTATDQEARQKLNQTFVVADLVKFAKMQPLPMEHDASLTNAIEFVKATMFLGDKAFETNNSSVHTEDKSIESDSAFSEGKEVKDV
jgi:cell division protein YceG involved in septum cleavage